MIEEVTFMLGPFGVKARALTIAVTSVIVQPGS
jgi:hypothetical protein